MDLIKFEAGTSPTELNAAQVVEGFDSLTWVERYRKAGEFKIVAPMSSGLIDTLPIHTLVSMTESLDLMFVENHVLKEKRGKDPIVEISGRSFDAWLTNRIVGMEQDLSGPVNELDGVEIILAEDPTWDQVVTLINTHIDENTIPNNPGDALPSMVAMADNPGTLTSITATEDQRTLKRGEVYGRVLEILGVDDLGLRMVRRNPFGDLGDPDDTWFLVHAGTDRSGSVIFSWTAGDLDSADYLWSGKTDKNSALVMGDYYELSSYSFGDEGFDRRSTIVEASDIDGLYTDPPIGLYRDDVLAAMATRGRQEMAEQNAYILTRADISPNASFTYREDYDIGDIISLDGSYGDIVPMRVTEFTQILDKGNETGHPTLEALYT